MTDEQRTEQAADAEVSLAPDEEAATAVADQAKEAPLEITLEDEPAPAEADNGVEAPAAEAAPSEEAPAGEPELVVEIEDEEPPADLSAEAGTAKVEADPVKEEASPDVDEPKAVGAETLELSADDLLVVDLDADEPALPPLARKPAELDLSEMDFSSEPASLPTKAPAWSEPAGESLPGKADLSGKSAGPTTAAFSYAGVLFMAFAGLLGGLLGWVATEPLQSSLQGNDLATLVMQTALYAGLAGGAIGLVLGIGNGFSVGVASKAVRWAAYGLLWGALGGALGGGLAQKIYGALSVDYVFSTASQLLLRATGWSIMGLFFGLGQSAVVIADKKMRNGIIGGAVGGWLGGMAFELLVHSAHGPSGRCLALCAMGLCIGALIGLVEEAAKEAWVRVTAGPLTGKQFILYEERTVIGNSPACSITLFKDPQVLSEHAAIQNDRTEFVIASLLPGAVVLVNGRPTSRKVLEDGDSIGIGNTQMEFRERKKDEEHKTAGKAKKALT